VRAECAAHALAVREPYGVWGGFSEAERLRLLAVGWEDLADRHHGRVDLARLDARLGRPHKSAVPAQRQVPAA
jgi:WhiB family transcriptional regulator, redox-sensing transcriptional regulator